MDTAAAPAPLQVGEMAYDAVIVPGCETLRASTLERLEAFQAAGGQLVFLGDAPTLVDAVPSERGKALWQKAQTVSFSQEAVLEALAPVRLVDMRAASGSRTTNLIHQLRRDGDGLWLFVAHCREPYNKDIPRGEDVRITVKGQYSVSLYNTQTGEVLPANAQIVGGNTVIRAKLYDYDSLLLRLDETSAAFEATACAEKPASSALALPVKVNYTLDEPNVYLLDKAEFALDGGAYRPAQELLRADNVLRESLGWPSRRGAVAQPWTVQEEAAAHTVQLRFTVQSAIETPVKLATEDAELAKVRFNGKPVGAKPEGWYVDKSIGCIELGSLIVGENVIEIELPFGRRTNVEWAYLLGDFGVKLMGEAREIVARPAQLGFGSVTVQELPHYGGNIAYHIPVETTGKPLSVTVPHYRGAAVRVAVDGKPMGHIAYPPYRMELGTPEAGTHTITLTVLGNRDNAFGPVHRADVTNSWIGPDAWRTTDAMWTDSYWLSQLGLLSAPWVEEEK